MKNKPYIIAKISILFLIINVPICLGAKIMDAAFLNLNEHNKDSIYKEIPKCPAPKTSYYSYVNQSTVLVFWDDLPAVKSELEYEVRYRGNTRGGWRVKSIDEGQSILIDDLKPGLAYSFEIRKICYSEIGAFKVEGEWGNIKPMQVRSSSLGINCDTLGEVEIIPGNGFTSSFSVPSGIRSSISGQDCYLIFHLVYCRIVNGLLRCEDIYWVYDGTQMINFSLDIDRLYPHMNLDSTTTPYLESAYVSVYCEPDTTGIFALPEGDVYGTHEWDSLDLDLDCLDTLLFSSPDNLNPHCGEPFEIPGLGTGALSSAQVGDTFTIAGYPLVLTAVSGGSGIFSGEADLVLPWQGTVVNIPFTSVSVNLDKQITSGSLLLESDPLFDPDEIEMFDIGGQICVPPDAPAFWDSLGNHSVTGLPWDPNGFGQDSMFKFPPYPGYEEGDPYDPNYDPNGFNFEGNHAVTGTIYNELGCSQAGIDTSGMPCNPVGSGPYYWLNNDPTGPPTLEGIELANEVKDTLDELILELLGIMELNMEDTLATQRNSCDAIRANMDDLLEDLEYNRDFIYGPEDEYYLERMSENFSSRPMPFDVDMDRNPDTEDLENKHIDLYDCDKKVIVYLNILDLIGQLGGSPDLEDFISLILEKIKRFSSSQVDQYESMEALIDWLEDEILIQLDFNYRQEYGSIIGMNDQKNHDIWGEEKSEYLNYNEYASIGTFSPDINHFHPLSIASNSPYSTISKFRNGDLWIDGVHRAQILEMIVDNKATMASIGGLSIMPIEISKELFGLEYTILIDRILLTPSGGEVDVFMVIQDPKSGQGLVFQSLGLEFSPNGIIGNGNLSLASEVPIRLSNAARLLIHGTPETYVSWDCSGFTGMGIDASVEFCRNFLTPLDTLTLEPLPEYDSTRVMAHFTVDIPVWGEFIAELSITPFAVTKFDQVRWVVEEAILDFSEIESREIAFPENYTSPFVLNGVATNEWKGFYMKELSATFSPQFLNDTASITIGVHDAIFDDRGFTGTAFVNSTIVTLENGNLAGWPFSIDSIQTSFVANHLMGASMKGYINVPIFESATDTNSAITPKDCFSYSATLMNGGGYLFVVSTSNNSLKAPLFKGTEIILERNSVISLYKSQDEFVAKAHLNGNISISASSESSVGLEFGKITFTGFEISNVSPYFSPGIWSMPAITGIPIEIGGFGISVKRINLYRTEIDDEAALTFNLRIGFSGDSGGATEDSLGVFADARTQVIGKLNVVNNKQKWVFDRIVIDQVAIDATIKGNRIVGGLIFYEENETYGKGFRGILKMDINSLKAEVDAVAQFGRHDNGFKYFFVDALVSLDEGIGAGTFKILGLGGGLYHRMSRDTATQEAIPSFPTGLPLLGDMGVGLSGIQYLPDSTRGIGFKANVVFATEGGQNAFNGNASFEIAFNRNSGIDEIRFEGNVRFMSEVDFGGLPTFQKNGILPPSTEIPLCGYVRILFDFENSILEGDINVFLNTPTLSGSEINGQVVWAKLYFSKHIWFVNIGKPSNPCGMVLEIPGVGVIGEVKAYINIGDGIEPMPDLPEQVRAIAGEFRPNPMRSRGRGFAFGASLIMSTGEKKFIFLRATLEAGAGFDILLQDYGDATCHHSGEKPGINGWYASGQVYAFLKGNVSVKIAGKVIPVLELAVAAAMRGRMPNPIWLEGAFGVKYDVAGLIKGSCKFRFNIGQECQLVSVEGDSSILDYTIIDHISPVEGSFEIPTDGIIEVYCNYPIDYSFENGIEAIEYKIQVNTVKLLWRNLELPLKYQLADGGFLLKANCTHYLPDFDTIYFIVKFDILENNVLIESESDTIWFVTGDNPDFIPTSNLDFTYPMAGQYNFHPKEVNSQKGFIYLKLGQPYLFDNEDKPDLLLISSPTGETVELNYTYDYLDNLIEFALPAQILEPGGLYKIALVSLDDPIQDAEEFTSNGINLPGLQSAPPIQLFMPFQGDNSLTLADKKVLVKWVFRVSIYDTFKQKISTTGNVIGSYSPPVDINLGIYPAAQELLSHYDLTSLGSGTFKSFIKLNPNDIWYKSNKLNKMYELWTWTGYDPGGPAANFGNFTGLLKPRRTYSYPPNDAIKMVNPNSQSTLVTEANFLSGQVYTSNIQKFNCETYKIMQEDYRYLKNQLSNYILNNPGAIPSVIYSNTTEEMVVYILNNDFPILEGELSALHNVSWLYEIKRQGIMSSFSTIVFGL